MKVLHLAPSVPWPPQTGGMIAIWNQVRADARHAEIALLAFADDAPAPEALGAVRAFCREVVTVPRPRTLDGPLGGLKSLVGRDAMNVAKYHWPVFSRALHEVVSRFRPDVVVAHNLHLGDYLLEVDGPAVILREQNIDSDLMERYAATLRNPVLGAFARMQARKVRAAEQRIAHRVHACLMISAVDEVRLREIAPGARTAVLPGVIEPAEYRPARPASPGDDLLVVATGTFKFPPTAQGLVDFLETVWPRVVAAAPRARFRVIGHCPEALKHRLEQVAGVDVLGRVESVEAHLDGAHVFVVPLRAGSGMRMRILEAMAWQLPIVTTSIGCEGIEVESGRELIVADQPGAMASAILRIAGDERLARSLREAGHRFVEAHYSLESAARSAQAIYRRCIAASGGDGALRRASS